MSSIDIDAALAVFGAFTFTATVQKLRNMCADNRCPAPVLSGVVSSDPMVSFMVLHRANAGLGGERQALTHLGQAVTSLGLSGMAGLLDEMASVPDNLKRTLGGCWSTANAASTMARLLAERVPSTVLPTGTDARFAGLCGLLHDIGSLVAIKAFPDAYSRAGSRLLDGEGPFSEMLRDELGWDQARLASTWAAHWELPEALVSALRHQLEPDVEQPYQGLAAILHLTRVLCRSCGFVSGVDLFVEPIDPIALNLLGLKQNDLLAVLDDFFSEMAELELYESALGGGLADEAPVL